MRGPSGRGLRRRLGLLQSIARKSHGREDDRTQHTIKVYVRMHSLRCLTCPGDRPDKRMRIGNAEDRDGLGVPDFSFKRLAGNASVLILFRLNLRLAGSDIAMDSPPGF